MFNKAICPSQRAGKRAMQQQDFFQTKSSRYFRGGENIMGNGTLVLIAESGHSTSDENITCGNKHKIF
jgi:hypothetical protein